MIEQLPNDLDSIREFLIKSGWSIGCYSINQKGRVVWVVDAVKGDVRFVVRHRTLKRSFMLVRYFILSMN